MNDSTEYNIEKDKLLNRHSNKPQMRLIDSSELFVNNNEIMIRHEGAIYRLRITKNGKLVMNK
jgi:hemin uptake protein HemP